MNKYELAVVVSAKIDDEARNATIEKCKALIERFGGVITNVDDWGKKKLAYEIDKMTEAFYTGRNRISCPHHGQCHQVSLRKKRRGVKTLKG